MGKSDRKAIGDDIATAEYGWPVGMPICRKIFSHKDLWEIRSDISDDRIARVLFTVIDGYLILLHGFYQEDAEDGATRIESFRETKIGAKTMKKRKNIGSSFEDFLKEEGVFEETSTLAIKRVLTWQISELMKRHEISKMEMARRMHTSRSQLDRFLDPDNDKVLLETVQRAASALGKRVSITLEDAAEPA